MDASSAFKDSLPTSPDILLEKLVGLDISFTTHTHPPLRTVEDAKAFRSDLPGDLPGAHIKNLYLRDRKKRNFLVVVREDRQIDLKSLGGQIGSDRLSFGSADRLFEMLGVRPGAVSPFTLINDPDHKVQLILDADLAGQSCLYAHPLVNDMTLGLSGADLLRFTAYTGHQPQLLGFA
ncbi:prolyl-tRNA synthetase associated domain-containing protein [Alphaproteobacteria bacterium]|nr:prolyl-tRNA synthetase associated domain-containing protein [Alphaproteobacteria bacterium]MDC1121119.1 prolyl-tRNA synthetase associated domain-containing protein [Alphaproteobacteria bacterium]